MMESVREWNSQVDEKGDKSSSGGGGGGGRERICVSLELEKPQKHPLAYAELSDVVFISQVYAEEVLQADNMTTAVAKARQLIHNKK